MKNQIEYVKKQIRTIYNLSDLYKIIFTGNGTTGAINHLVNCINYNIFDKVYIIISSYEHYSNHLPWVEVHNTYKHCEIIIIPFNDDNILDLIWFENKINNIYKENNKILLITSLIHCSNVNGLFLPIKKIKDILNNYNNNLIEKYLFLDLACSAPYINIDLSLYDAVFFSPHKFIGGISTPGVLIANNKLFTMKKAYCPGGGCIVKIIKDNIIYKNDIEKKETAGTPNIIGIIRIGKMLEIKNKYQDIITNNEHILYKIIKSHIKYFEKKYKKFKTILYNDNENHLPILSFYILDLHYNFIVKLFNDLFGIQTRGGIACAGLLADYIKKIYNCDGWVRISFHWIMTKNEIHYIFDALKYIIKNGDKYLKYYKYDIEQNLYYKI